MENKLIADIFEDIAALLSVSERPTARFEVRAYQKAALTISTIQEPIEDIYQRGGIAALMELPGIGKGLAQNIEEYVKTGRMRKYDELKRRYPIDIHSLTSIEGLGPKKAIRLYQELGVKDIPTLKRAVERHRISKLEGFGERSEEVIKKGLQMFAGSSGRMLLGDALPVAESMVAKLIKSGLVERAIVAGSTRRMRETVGDLDILALSKSGEKVSDLFVKLPEVSGTIVKGPTRTSVTLKIGMNCDLRVIAPESYGAAVQYFTGSKDHNIQVRTIAVRKGYKLNEYGLFDRKNRILPMKDEEAIYERLGMQWMPPEMREARGEVELAQRHKIPKLVELKDLRGDMHVHGMWHGGNVDAPEEMANAAKKMGLDYIALTNHTKELPIENGMNDRQFMQFLGKLDRLIGKLDGSIRVFKGAECGILKDGSLDLEAKTLKSMDWVVGSVHSAFGMSEEEMTRRVVKAIDSGMISVLGHPTGRQILEREGVKINLDKVLDAAERNNVALEINAQPRRLDLNDTNIMRAARYKVKFSIDSDSHRTPHFGYLKYGVGTARRGWLTKDRIINAMPLKGIERYMKR